MDISSYLTGKAAGLPRWAWVGLGGGSIVAALYIRSRQTAATTDETTDTGTPDPASSIYDSSDPGLAGAGAVGYATSPGNIVPVNSPTIPEGIPELFSTASTAISDLVGYITDNKLAQADAAAAVVATQAAAAVPVASPVGAQTVAATSSSGGGPPILSPITHVPVPTRAPTPKPVAPVLNQTVNLPQKAGNTIAAQSAWLKSPAGRAWVNNTAQAKWRKDHPSATSVANGVDWLTQSPTSSPLSRFV